MTKKHNQVIFTEKSPYYLVEVSHAEDENKNPISLKTVQAICRCGHSKKKPYCDSSHFTEGMDNTKSEDRKASRWLKYDGKELTVFFNPAICSHKGACLKIAENAFQLDRKPWILPDLDDVEKVKEAVAKCPSGALYYAIGLEKHIEFKEHTGVVIKSTGSMECKGIRLMDDLNSDHELLSKGRFVLCTCGKSKNKPFCDASHQEEK